MLAHFLQARVLKLLPVQRLLLWLPAHSDLSPHHRNYGLSVKRDIGKLDSMVIQISEEIIVVLLISHDCRNMKRKVVVSYGSMTG